MRVRDAGWDVPGAEVKCQCVKNPPVRSLATGTFLQVADAMQKVMSGEKRARETASVEAQAFGELDGAAAALD